MISCVIINTGNDAVEVRGMKDVESSVAAVTSLNDELYVALNNSRQIHVYHSDDLHFLRCLPVNGLGAQVTSVPYLLSCLISTLGHNYNNKQLSYGRETARARRETDRRTERQLVQLWRSVLSARAPACHKVKMVG